MSLIIWEYLRQNTDDLDRDHGLGWEEVGEDSWELVTIYSPHNQIEKKNIAVFKRDKEAFIALMNPEPPPSMTLGRAHNE